MNIEVLLNWFTNIVSMWAIFSFGKQSWDLFRGIITKQKAGRLLYKDSSLNPELVMAFILTLFLIGEIFLLKIKFIVWLWMPFVIVFLALKGLIRMEIRENGIFSKEGFLKWEDIKDYELEKKDKLFNLRIKTKNHLHKLTIDFNNCSVIDGLIKQEKKII